MIKGTMPGRALEPLRTLFAAGTATSLTDGQLLERFAGRRDHDAEAAFAALVSRHGPMVRRVCRSLLADTNDADDAFQATFLVLARKAAVVRRPELLANWLYGTAHRAAQTLKTRAARRLKHETREAAMAHTRATYDTDELELHATRREEARIIHEELARLPESCRVAVVLCELQARPQHEVAQLLRCSERTLRRRLDRARQLLRLRLVRRGLAPTAGLLAAVLTPGQASAAFPQITVDSTARAAVQFAAGGATAGVVPASASVLAEGVITAMLWTKLKAVVFAAGAVLVLGIGVRAGMGVRQQSAAQNRENRAEAKPRSGEGSQSQTPSPAAQYQALVQAYDLAMAAFNKLGENAQTQAEREAAYKGHHIPEEDFNPRFLALAQRYPNDPVAFDALVWILEKTMRYWDGYNRARGDAIDRTMEILARDHLADPRSAPSASS